MKPLSPHILTWNDSTITRLARGIIEEKAFERMPILADALEEAGCTDQQTVDHCRSNIVHCKNCPVLVAILGKKIVLHDSWTIPVDYSWNLQEKFGKMYAKTNISGREIIFDHDQEKPRIQEVIFRMYEYDTQVGKDLVISQMSNSGFRPCTLRELFVFGHQMPRNICGTHLFIALGASGKELHAIYRPFQMPIFSYFGQLSDVNNEYCRDLTWYQQVWDTNISFLGVQM